MIVIYRQPFQMLKQTFPCHDGCEQLMITHLLHITLIVKFVNEVIKFNGANRPQILTGPFGDSIHMFHLLQQWWVNKPWKKQFISRFEDILSPPPPPPPPPPRWWRCEWFELHPPPSKTTSDGNLVPCLWIMFPFHGEP
jgi:hypothetical protein